VAIGTKISFLTAQAMGQAITAALDAGSAGAVIEIRTGTPPVTVEEASTGTLLAVLTCSVASFDAGVDQSPGCLFTSAAITDEGSALANGTAGYFVAGSSNAADTILDKVILGTAGEASDDADMTLDNKVIAITGTVGVALGGWTFTMAEG